MVSGINQFSQSVLQNIALIVGPAFPNPGEGQSGISVLSQARTRGKMRKLAYLICIIHTF